MGENVTLFDFLDVDQGGILTIEEFFEGCILVLNGNETAKNKDIVATHLTCQSMHKSIHEITEQVIALLDSIGVDPSIHQRHISSTANMGSSHGVDQSEQILALEKRLQNHVRSLHATLDRLEQRIEDNVSSLLTKIDAVCAVQVETQVQMQGNMEALHAEIDIIGDKLFQQVCESRSDLHTLQSAAMLDNRAAVQDIVS